MTQSYDPSPVPALIGGLALGSIAAVFALYNILPLLAGSLSAGGKGFWDLSRVSGLTAYALFSLSMIFGLMLSSRMMLRTAVVMLSWHRFSALLALGVSVFHALILYGDAYLHPQWWQLFTPFALEHRLWWWIGLGQLAFYALLPIAAAFYLRRGLGVKTWRVLHYTVFTAYLAATAHGFFAGSDTRTWPAPVIYTASNSAVVALIAYRILSALSGKAAR